VASLIALQVVYLHRYGSGGWLCTRECWQSTLSRFDWTFGASQSCIL